jgi:N-methylhydantoinase A
VASRHVAQLCGYDNAIGLDMGGTSTDISLVHEGKARLTNEWFVEYGYPIRFPSIEVLTIGAGGGSLAHIDQAGSLRNGPQSAGADPGPACYGAGGAEPTNTDANLVLGRLGATLVGGAMRLDAAAAHDAIRARVAEPLGLGVQEAAGAIIEVANANMADALRLISLQRGYDPREFALVVFGGAGPLHGAALARELSIPTVLIPPSPGTWSALGCLMVDIRHDLSTMYLDVPDPAVIERELEMLDAEGRALLEAEGVPAEGMQLVRSIDMRYQGQWRSMTVEVPRPLRDLDPVIARFHDEHEREHSYRRDGAPVEIYRLNLTALGATEKAELPRHALNGSMPEPRERRTVVFDEPVETPVYERSSLGAGASFTGPAVIDQLDSTILVPPDAHVEVDEWLNVRMS